MSPELRTRSSLSPFAARGVWLTGGAVASLALVFAGVATPASASVTPSAGSVVADPSTDDCKKEKENGHHEKYQPEGKAQTPVGPLHEQCEDRDRDKEECSDIDSATMGNREVSAVLTGGNVFAGDRTFNGQSVDDYEWEEISDNRNFPKNACSVSVSLAANDAWVKVLTTQGTVYETHGDRSGSDFEWDERWRKLTNQPGEDDEVTSTREKGELVAPVQPNS
ncbi:hypothetical protein GCM10010306_054180 [Streptomyces umbrinus]|uniref:hypothetical protein n=1 Tax=Streptomyces umbrinus TaxID=67370 RepID=UPI001671AC79|nr:hypothetical protein [Streptomyces umbrinus]GHB53773.1 hypothetical protein GCM10010306_054180 [Streptomyces umbrinus]